METRQNGNVADDWQQETADLRTISARIRKNCINKLIYLHVSQLYFITYQLAEFHAAPPFSLNVISTGCIVFGTDPGQEMKTLAILPWRIYRIQRQVSWFCTT